MNQIELIGIITSYYLDIEVYYPENLKIRSIMIMLTLGREMPRQNAFNKSAVLSSWMFSTNYS